MAENNNNTLPPLPKGYTVKQEVVPPLPKGYTVSKPEPVEAKPIQVSKEKYEELKKSYSALDETFNSLKADLGELAKPFHPSNIDNTYRDKALGIDIPIIQPPSIEPEEKHDDPYKALLKVNAKQFNINDSDLDKNIPGSDFNKQKINSGYFGSRCVKVAAAARFCLVGQRSGR